jgi:hypothetical protein
MGGMWGHVGACGACRGWGPGSGSRAGPRGTVGGLMAPATEDYFQVMFKHFLILKVVPTGFQF